MALDGVFDLPYWHADVFVVDFQEPPQARVLQDQPRFLIQDVRILDLEHGVQELEETDVSDQGVAQEKKHHELVILIHWEHNVRVVAQHD